MESSGSLTTFLNKHRRSSSFLNVFEDLQHIHNNHSEDCLVLDRLLSFYNLYCPSCKRP